ncbi:MAG: AsnC family transcriptional regulator, partial [Chloroflexota bacterium]|nr:AsnC family transcriptional regulator [Chloroflexota bacterium]
MDLLDRKLINLLQESFPLEGRPFARLGEQLGTEEGEILRRVQSLKERGLVRQISAIFDTRALGYQSSLVAFRLAPGRLDEAASRVSLHPGVSHNYARDHSYNLWFTLALPPGEDMGRAVQKLAQETGAESALLLPALRVFKLQVYFDMVGDSSGDGPSKETSSIAATPALSPREIEAIRALQQDLSLESCPFQPLAQRLGCEEGELLEQARDFLRRGLMRRYGVMLNHRRAGIHGNAMGCWAVPASRVEEVGQVMAAFKEVSHC